MVNAQKVKDAILTEGKQVVAESESVLSQFIGFLTPRWDKFVVVWKTWSIKKKTIAIVLACIIGMVGYDYLPSPGRVFGKVGEFLPSRAKVVPATENDLSQLRKSIAADTINREEFYQLQDRVSKLEKDAATPVVPAKPVTTGSIRRKKKTVAE